MTSLGILGILDISAVIAVEEYLEQLMLSISSYPFHFHERASLIVIALSGVLGFLSQIVWIISVIMKFSSRHNGSNYYQVLDEFSCNYWYSSLHIRLIKVHDVTLRSDLIRVLEKCKSQLPSKLPPLVGYCKDMSPGYWGTKKLDVGFPMLEFS